MNKRVIMMLVAAFALIISGAAGAQMGPGMGMGPCPGGGPEGGHEAMGGHMHGGPGMGMGQGHGMGRGGLGMGHGPGMGKWWKNSAVVKQLGLTDAQVQQIENVFQKHRMELIDLRAALEKEEVKMEPLVEADHPDQAQVTAQIDRVAQARASLEKSNALMLLGIRQVLTVDQWKQLRSQGCGQMRGPGGRRPGGPGPGPAGAPATTPPKPSKGE